MKKMKAAIAGKLKGNKGETLAEVLISMLIAALALTMLAYAITSTARIVNKNKKKMELYYQANDAITAYETELSESSEISGLVSSGDDAYSLVDGDDQTVYLSDDEDCTVTVFVNKAAGDERWVVSYRTPQETA